jgi:signal transduction histidine kinase
MRRPVIGVVVLVFAAALVVSTTLPAAQVAYRSSALRAALGTLAAAAVVPLLVLVLERLRLIGQRRDLFVAAAIGLYAIGICVFADVPAVVSGLDRSSFWNWARLTTALVTGALLILAAAIPRARLRRIRSWAVAISALTALALLGEALGAAAVAGGTDPSAPGAVRTGYASAALFGLAAFGLGGRGIAERDELYGWIAVAAALAGAARLDAALFPTTSVATVSTADLLRLASCLALLVAARRELPRLLARLGDRARLAERSQIARDLHDGLAQELAYIVTKSRLLAAEPGANPDLARIATAGERALDESRRAIELFSRVDRDPFSTALPRAVEDVAARAGASVDVRVDEGLEPEPEIGEALIRIAREAVANAARHGRARTVRIELQRNGGYRLRVADDGCGFEPEAAARHGGFGLRSMRERAQALGGTLDIRSKPAAGAEIEVVIP